MININTVYSRVLLLANKEQRGYITPEEFNSFANQAQLEIFESYFIKKAQAMGADAGNDSDYANPVMNLEEKLTLFDLTATDVAKTDNIFEYSSISADFYRLGVVLVNNRVADEVSHRDAAYVNLSPLTAPTTTQPIYTRHSGGVRVYPDSVAQIDAVYLRKPVEVAWAFLMDPNDEPVYDSANSTDFELHSSEEHDLVYKVLTLSGVAIKQQDLAQFGISKEGQLAQTE